MGDKLFQMTLKCPFLHQCLWVQTGINVWKAKLMVNLKRNTAHSQKRWSDQ